MAELIVVTGPPGAGKSTVAALLAGRYDPSVLVEGDAFFAFLATGSVPPWLPVSDQQNTIVTEAAAAATGRFVTGGYPTVYDGVLGPWFLPTFADATGLESLHYVVLLPSAERCVAQVGSRLGHAFTDEPATRHMHAHFAAAAVEDRHVQRDLLDDPGQVIDAIVQEMADGRWLYRR